MRIYLASVYVTHGSRHTVKAISYPHVLESYHYVAGQRFVNEFRQDKVRIFLDSGAFSAFTKSATININQYAEYINRNPDVIEFAANLDHIAMDKKASAEGTWANQQRLEQLVTSGTYVVPVYHVREDPKYLVRIAEKYPFIAIGGMVPESKPDLLRILDELWDRYLTDKEGRPLTRVHGFGLTTFDLMLRYPWWSVDSSSWQKIGSFGGVIVARADRQIVQVKMSGNSPSRKDLDAHFDSLSPAHQLAITTLIEAKGFTIEQLRTDYRMRHRLCMITYGEIMGTNAQAFKKPSGDLFSDQNQSAAVPRAAKGKRSARL